MSSNREPLLIENPNAPFNGDPSSLERFTEGDVREIHPDWLWMTIMVHLFGALALTAVFFSHGDVGWRLTCHDWLSLPLFGPGSAVPRVVLPIVLAVFPTLLVSVSVKCLYRNRSTSQKMTARNFFFLLTGMIFAIINASLYDQVS